ncbi:MAG: ABC transporter permease, partial [Candidatus Aminicenantes bacterium]|nr:ABC transporter permease [Candidatus Aminicenantes bacterium]
MFDLESAINNWKRTFRRQAAFEDGFIADLEVHLRDLIEELKTEGHSDEDAFREASSRLGTADSLAPDYDKVKEYRLDRRSSWRPARFLPGLPWHYAKVAFRKIRRHKSFSVITVAGLAVGMACFLLLATAIQFETSFDRFHEKAGRMYRVSVSDHGTDGEEYSLSVPEILSRVAAGGIPEVAAA